MYYKFSKLDDTPFHCRQGAGELVVLCTLAPHKTTGPLHNHTFVSSPNLYNSCPRL